MDSTPFSVILSLNSTNENAQIDIVFNQNETKYGELKVLRIFLCILRARYLLFS